MRRYDISNPKAFAYRGAYQGVPIPKKPPLTSFVMAVEENGVTVPCCGKSSQTWGSTEVFILKASRCTEMGSGTQTRLAVCYASCISRLVEDRVWGSCHLSADADADAG